jgi:DNA-binding NarL/FixJ family response regulator
VRANTVTRIRPAIGVIVVDEHRLVRAGLRLMLESDGDIAVLAEAASGGQAVAAARSLRPDVVLMDVRLPDFDGLEVTRRISSDDELTSVGVLLLTATASDVEMLAALHAGAHGVLPRDIEPSELLRAVRLVASGGALLAPRLARRLIDEILHVRSRGRSLPGLEELTAREREVMALAAYGLSNVEIAAHLRLSTATVKTHVARTLTKLGVRDRAALVGLAYESGLVIPG